MMKKHIYRSIGLILTSLLLCTSMSGIRVWAEDEEEPEYLLTYHGEEETKVSSIQELQSTMRRSSYARVTAPSIPESYRTEYVTSVKSQGSYGTCWAHSVVAAAESNMIMDGIADTNIDLSELQLAYFMYHPVVDSMGGLTGDSFVLDSSYGNYLSAGGNAELAIYHIASWKGLSDEAKAPYSNADSNGSLDDSLAYDDAAHLQNSYWISMKDRDLVKNAVMEYGAAAVSYYDNNEYYNQNNHYDITEELAYYCPNSNLGTNHGVTLVGWDDNFSKDNFGTYKPSSDGAWLIKNSWGSYYGNDGYFWISYEDATLGSGNAYFIDMESADNYDHNYQYDGSITCKSKTFYTKEANVYTATSAQTLEAVGFYTADALYNYTVTIYKNIASSDPTGTVMTTQSGSEMYAGFHTVVLDSPVILNAGDTFSVVIEQSTYNGGRPTIYYDYSYSYGWCTGVSHAEDGQSYMYSTSGWQDFSSYDYNCRIKAYANDRSSTDPIIPVESLTLNRDSETLFVGDTTQLSSTVLPENATNPNVQWTSSNEEIASVDQTGKVTAIAAGEAVITCSAEDGSGVSASCSIEVKEHQLVTDISITPGSVNLNVNETKALTAAISPSDADNKEVRWTSSNSGVASVKGITSANGYAVITANAAGTATITCTATDGSGIKAICNVTVEAAPAYDDPGTGSSSSSSSSTSSSSTSSSSTSSSSTSSSSSSANSSSSSNISSYANYTPTQAFVARLYEKCLGREPDSDGLKHWNSVLVNRERSGAQVAYGFVFSKEYTQRHTSDADYVEMLYQVFMDRASDAGGKQHWLDLLSQGVSREYVFRGFAQSTEYTNICYAYGIERGSFKTTQARDVNVNVTSYVNRMYTKALGRNGEEAGLNHWCNTIYTKTRTPEQVAEAFINSTEFKNKKLNNEEYIKVLYRTFMGREADASGLQHWLNELSRGCSREEILHRFATSKEFRNIQAQFGL